MPLSGRCPSLICVFELGLCFSGSPSELPEHAMGISTKEAVIIDLSTNHVESYICRKSKRSARQISYVYSYSGKRRCETS